MKKYAVSYREILSKTCIVKAKNLEAAIEKLREAALDGKVIVEYDDLYDSETVVSPDANEDGTATEFQLKYCEELEDEP